MIVTRCLRSFLVLLLTLSSSFAQVDEADKLEAVHNFQKFFRKYKEEAQQVEAVMTLKGNECHAAAEELLKLLKHPTAGVQAAALAVIETYKDAATFQAWIDALPVLKDWDQVAMLAKLMGRAKIKAALPALQKVVSDTKASPTARFEIARALLQIGDPTVAPTVESLLGDADPLVRMAAADCVSAMKLKALAPKITGLLTDSEWQVQSAAIAAAGVVRPQEAVQPLIELMRKPGRLRIECADALFRVTGYDFGVDPDRWQEQWTKLLSITGFRIPTDEELAKKAESRKKTDAFYGKKGQTNTFAKIQTTSTRVLFIIDISGSMDDLVVEHEKFQGYKDYKKFTIVKTELLNTLDTLTQDTWFDIVAFASDLQPWRKKLVPANIVNRDAAKAWVGNLAPLGGVDQQDLAAAGLGGSANLSAGKTNTLKALMYPFGVDPDSPVKQVFTGGDRASIKNKLDTVYFLSDGRPSIGKLVETREILKEVRRYNEVFRLVIHAIAIGEFQKDFMKDLAERNGGVFIDMGR